MNNAQVFKGTCLFVVIDAKFWEKSAIHYKKLLQLGGDREKPIPKKRVGIIKNASIQTFDKNEIDLLSMGLKFALALDGAVAHVESSVKELLQPLQCSKTVVKSLKSKHCFYVKADKVNNVIILDKRITTNGSKTLFL